MSDLRVLITGFGSFERVERNPSGELALRLDGLERAGARLCGVELPVSFRRGPRELNAVIEARRPDVILATGVHKTDGFRLESLARAELVAGRPDADGVGAEDLPLTASTAALRPDLDLERLLVTLESSAIPSMISTDAGGYVCECVYHRVLESGVPGIFLHVPPLEYREIDEQLAAVLPLIDELVSCARERFG